MNSGSSALKIFLLLCILICCSQARPKLCLHRGNFGGSGSNGGPGNKEAPPVTNEPTPSNYECPLRKCKPCTSGYIKDEHGCQTCNCLNPCEPNYTCPDGQHCEPQNVQCIRAPCYPVPNCVDDVAVCPLYKCKECASGNRIDENGCKTCACIDPCEGDNTCSDSEQCYATQEQCTQEPCYNVAICAKPCPWAVRCRGPCPSGFRSMITENNEYCQTCACINPCESNSTCPDGQHCEANQVQCKKAPCYPVKECIDDSAVTDTTSATTTQDYMCPMCLPAPGHFCKSGYRKDFRGCQTCQCIDPCEFPSCGKDELCIAQEVQCFVAPCYKEELCVPGVTDTTAATLEETTTQCPAIKCDRDRLCSSGYRKTFRGCPTCDCIDPCEYYDGCTAGERCMPLKVQCFVAPCYDVPRCVPVDETSSAAPPAEVTTQCAPVECDPNRPCTSGYRTIPFTHGCQTCECIDPCEYSPCEQGQTCIATSELCADFCTTSGCNVCYPKPSCDAATTSSSKE